jgi:flagellar biosynthetic protein FliR
VIAALFLTQAIAFGLAFARVSGFIAVSPFPGPEVPRSQRAGLAIVIAFAASYASPTRLPASIDASLCLAAASEILCGLVMGCGFRFLYVAAEFLGYVVSHSIGLTMATVLNPAISNQDMALSRALTLCAQLLALEAGVHRTALACVMRSFAALPLGSAGSFSLATPILVDTGLRSMEIGVQLGMPVIGVCLVVNFGLAMIARAAPSLQILHVGLGVLLASGTATLLAVLPDVMRSLVSYYATFASLSDALLAALGAAQR